MRFPSIANVAHDLRQEAKYLIGAFEPGELADSNSDYEGTDVRLQVLDDGRWAIHSGDASYDQDHRGYWGASSISRGATLRECREVARDLLSQAKEDQAMSAEAK